jgi:hypothetical protein
MAFGLDLVRTVSGMFSSLVGGSSGSSIVTGLPNYNPGQLANAPTWLGEIGGIASLPYTTTPQSVHQAMQDAAKSQATAELLQDLSQARIQQANALARQVGIEVNHAAAMMRVNNQIAGHQEKFNRSYQRQNFVFGGHQAKAEGYNAIYGDALNHFL